MAHGTSAQEEEEGVLRAGANFLMGRRPLPEGEASDEEEDSDDDMEEDWMDASDGKEVLYVHPCILTCICLYDISM
jgi:hypothetical protein